ncbi:MAG: class IV adenylate cyclase [Sedimentisphaerales bacterium]|nr:class IV adenylate cyclase [Sedimentisphaerales bacterium]
MYLEIEAKLKVDSLDDVRQRLAQCGAALLSETVQTDYYFDTPDSELTRADECIRLRRESLESSERLILTYKGGRQVDDFKKRREINLPVDDAEAVEHLLNALGYSRVLAFNKKRSTWHLDRCEVALDELPLIGAFVEIEGPDSDSISQVQHRLGLAETRHTTDSYASQITKEMSRLGLAQKEVFL